MNKIMLIDGNSLMYRAYFGSAYGPAGILTNSKGFPVNAISVFNRMISKLLRNYDPSHLFIAFDSGKKTFRHDKLESYKGGRKSTPHELIKQFPVVKEMLNIMNIKHFEMDQIEADDIIGTLSVKLPDNDSILVVSSDRDLYQLVKENVKVILPQNGVKEDIVLDMDNFECINGYLPNQVIHMKAIVGDASDNLSGVKGIGEKGALKLINKYKTIESVYEHIDDFTQGIKDKLIASKENSFLCKELATLVFDVDVPFVLDDLMFEEKSSLSLVNFFNDLEIKSLVSKYEKMLPTNMEDNFEKLIF
ncbi:5'-3' exonuclease [Candidatus Mycoplasma mahonii]|uniref:5'-3' exonuclease n=1 Tax=Candidatus Mycoplasma mahonii TaxID=3004105 RepID=UPI0026F1FE50|nr:5'-3' exonuclease H3TH domain-containing protein [Candidatus Mycoplasma mahonii]WKX02698.1 5'-3' exonuclease [Candidatus Mycoplasma mahonii]